MSFTENPKWLKNNTSTHKPPTVIDKYENHSACPNKIKCVYLEKLLEENIQPVETLILNSKNENA